MKKIINFLYTGFLLGYLTHHQISNWADKELVKENNEIPESILLDISLCESNHLLTSLLLKNKEQNFQNILDYYLSLYNSLAISKKISYEILSKEILAAFSVSNNSFQDNSFIELDEKYNLFFTRLKDYIELVRDGFPGNMDIPKELIEFLSNYNEDITIFKELNFNVKGVQIAEL